jgi:hypothetical protein
MGAEIRGFAIATVELDDIWRGGGVHSRKSMIGRAATKLSIVIDRSPR